MYRLRLLTQTFQLSYCICLQPKGDIRKTVLLMTVVFKDGLIKYYNRKVLTLL